ncbi:toll/interleukin-1 receptor domain-containing protein [Agrobacterium radiobacter]
MTTDAINPRVFISYSWSNQDHQNQVIDIAKSLVGEGIDVVLDVWDLKPGNDSYVFMESMVSDNVTKVLMLCDETYVKKSDDRQGGAGTEAQIITPKIYREHNQDKFVAAIMGRDENGNPYIPTYYGGRIYFDLTSPTNYPTEFEKIVRWAWGKPLHEKPALGVKPAYLDETAKPSLINSGMAHRAALSALKTGSKRSAPLVNDFFDTIISGMEEFRIKYSKENEAAFDEIVLASIDAFIPYRNEIIEVFEAIAKYEPTAEFVDVIVRFIERLLPFLETPPGIHQSYEWDYDNYAFIIHELYLYLIAALIEHERFNMANDLIEKKYYWNRRGGYEVKMYPFTVIRTYLKSLAFRNERLKLNRVNVRADKLKERNSGTGISFDTVMLADFLLYFRSASIDRGWFPETLIYLERFGGAFELFARAQSKSYFDRVKVILGVKDVVQLKAEVEAVQSDFAQMGWGYSSVSAKTLLGISQLASSP